MSEQKIYIINFKSLYDIFDEVKNLLSFKIFQIKIDKIDKKFIQNEKNCIFIIDDISKIDFLNDNRVLELNSLPISFTKLIEKINLLFLKINFQSKSEVQIKKLFFGFK